MKRETRLRVWQRADSICEYCRLWQEHEPFFRFQVEHIIPKKHRGNDSLANLALACFRCNSHKSSNLTGIDFQTGKIVALFHPRRHKWDHHFCWQGIMLVGKTPIGRATVEVLAMNLPARLALRESLASLGQWPYDTDRGQG